MYTSRRINHRDHSQSRQEVMDSLPTFWPICTILITLVQIVLFIAVCATYGLAPIAISAKTERSGCLLDFADTTCHFESKQVAPNFFIGPSSETLIHVGAQYTPVSLLYIPTYIHIRLYSIVFAVFNIILIVCVYVCIMYM